VVAQTALIDLVAVKAKGQQLLAKNLTKLFNLITTQVGVGQELQLLS
jgi:hypothetical protein